MSSSGLIFAVIVGAWAAYLVPMWLRRQDELNEARPTERFSTAIRLLTRGRRAQEAEATAQDDLDAPRDEHDDSTPGDPGVDEGGAGRPSADVRAFAKPVTAPKPAATPNLRTPRTKVLVRRRRTTMALLLAFTLGGIFTLSTGPGFLWLPAIPAALLIAYVVHVRRQERRRYAVALDRRRAEEAARRLRERTQKSASAVPEQPSARIVEQTDHAEWVDHERRRAPAAVTEEPESWDPAPVPLPTYVSAPVAPRTTRGVDLDAPDTWSAARSTTAGGPPAPPTPRADPKAPQRTPLFDQYAEEDRRRAAGE
ncbi:hypothetical protein [Streptomyces radicis]|uniref:Uncharacterized protein n=1 Tax=Streptomyces radicis TaxID=1750517 RepID=A0A3A9WDV1_9ACTN|nr:hypothetical protein [Streptomyces radicis]RKN04187.1 hypothetical protein D7319_29275 [Streptomyces radicis]RKN14534.1 hypothetical protein D7318_29145 [Streptomyces radicis]